MFVVFGIFFCLLSLFATVLIAGYDSSKRLDSIKEEEKIRKENQAAIQKLKQEQKIYDEGRNKFVHEQEKLKICIEKSESEKERLIQLREEVKKETDSLSQLKKEITAITRETKQHHPELARQISDAQYYLDTKIYEKLLYQKRPAVKAAEEVRKIASEKKQLLFENKQLQYQIDFYEKMFPWLEEFKSIPSNEAIEYAKGTYAYETDAVRKWLSPEEYEKLDNAEKYQLALDRWRNRKKEDWDIGIEYERYIGYRLESDGYKVTYLGATLGLKDMGRDLLAKKGDKVLVIQCKRWSKEKTIHEKHIFQLYGSTAMLSIENPNVEYKGVFITSTELSETARKCADFCKISVVENCPMEDYPLIKCNFSKTGEKIYHLPFDQQYDKIVISKNKQSCYVWTTKEAEEKGFRRAYRWTGNKESFS